MQQRVISLQHMCTFNDYFSLYYSAAMSTLTCVTVTTLVLISLVNFVLLMGVMMQMKKKCDEDEMVSKIPNNVEFNRLSSLVKSRYSKSHRPKFMAALVAIKYDKLVLMCGTTIISQFWILTTAHCCLSVKNYPVDDVKVSSNSPRWKIGIPHDVEEVIVHASYTPSTATHNICVVRVRQPFKEDNEVSVAVAGSQYRYQANSTAVAMGWNSKINEEDQTTDDVYITQVTLINYEICKKIFKDTKLDRTMICGKTQQKNEACSFDSGGPLFQNNIVIGVVSFETDCASGIYPRVYTRLSSFQEWIKQVEQTRGVKINARFKN